MSSDLTHRPEPVWSSAFVPDAKVRDYLLSDAQIKAQSRHKFFAMMGFSREAWAVLQQALLRHVCDAAVERRAVKEDEFGMTFVAVGPLATPSGRAVMITSYWLVRHGDVRPQFTSAIPGRR